MIKTIFKILFAIGILYWLITQGKLDFSLIGQSFKNPIYFFIGAFLYFIQILITAFRFGLLLRIKSQNLSYKNLINTQWIGLLFSTILPGAITSDLLKVGYIRNCDNKLSKSYILFSIFIDRILAANALFFISGVTSLIFFNELTSLNSSMEKIILINISLFIFSLFGISVIFLNKNFQNIVLKFIPTIRLKELTTGIWNFQYQKEKFLLAYFGSILSHIIGLFAFWVVNIPFFEFPVKMEYLTTLIPIGHVSVAIPISPGGIGVGHAAFSTLFHFIGQSNGASLYNVYWLMCLVINLLGIIPFILNKSKIIKVSS